MLAVLAVMLASQAQANSYFYGQWKFGNCNLFLKGPELGSLKAETQWCDHEWAFVHSWRATASGVELLNNLNSVLARLTLQGDQLVVVSNTGTRVAFSRVGAPPPGATALRQRPGPLTVSGPHGYALQYTQKTGRCVYRGDGNACASNRDLGIPTSIPSNAPPDGRSAVITLVTSPAFRAKMGGEAPLRFRPKANFCIAVYACYETNGAGPWCYTRLNGQTGYIAKFGLRKDKAMFVNFVNGCEPGATNLVPNS